ncbi:MAG: hypothetical protein KC800_07975 [Candidatus Eremiobacteraeota bacterium]|nr:hypothetical protein [Candidatus Eremiobacteraeota bacterium]
MSGVAEKCDLSTWMGQAFRGNVPDHLMEMMEHKRKLENIFEEMLTQLPEETRPVMESLYEMHHADSKLMYEVLAELFLRHLDGHP